MGAVIGVPREQEESDPRVEQLENQLQGTEKQVAQLKRRLKKLAERVDELEGEITDARSQGRRAAEIADVVSELLANEASRRDPEFRSIVERYVGGR